MMNIEKAKKILIKYYKQQLKKLEENNFSKQDVAFIKIKFKHSFDCYRIGEIILEKDKILKNKSQQFKEKAKIAFLLHDVGRFFEISNELCSQSHGEIGSNLLFEKENFEDKSILIAIKNHDKAEIDCLINSAEAIEILKILKDADKLSNLYLFKEKNTVFTRKERKYGFSNEYFEALQNKHLIEKKYKNTIFDAIAYYIIWFYELNFEASQEFVIENELLEHLLNMFEFFINDLEKSELNYYSIDEVATKKNEMLNNLDKIKKILNQQGIVKIF